MKKLLLVVILGLSVGFLSGCSRKRPVGIVKWYIRDFSAQELGLERKPTHMDLMMMNYDSEKEFVPPSPY